MIGLVAPARARGPPRPASSGAAADCRSLFGEGASDRVVQGTRGPGSIRVALFTDGDDLDRATRAGQEVQALDHDGPAHLSAQGERLARPPCAVERPILEELDVDELPQ